MSLPQDSINLRLRLKGVFGLYILNGRVGAGYVGQDLDDAVEEINTLVQVSNSREVVIKSVHTGRLFGGFSLIEDNALKGLVERLNENNLGIEYKLFQEYSLD
jgi:hypothetical protein